MKFIDTLNKDEKDEYNAVKELLDEFNNSPNINLQNIIENKDEEVKKGESNEDNKIKENAIILEENESFSERISTKNDDFLYVHFKDRIFKIKTKNLLIMRE